MRSMNLGGIGVVTLLLAIGVLAAVVQIGRAQSVAGQASHHETLHACAQACSECQRQCDACATHCGRLIAEGKHDHLTTLMTCQDCATICVAAAQVVSRGGPFSELICQACADACARCGRQCDKFADDEPMRACAAACRKCEAACREMAKELVLK